MNLSTPDEASPLQTVVQEFNAYLYRSFTANNKDFCLVTFGEAPLKRWLRADAKRKGVKLVAHYSKFLDLQAEFRRQKPGVTLPATAGELATALGLEFDDAAKGGMEPCRGMCRALGQMLAEGSKCNSTVNIPEDYDPFESLPEAANRVAREGSGGGGSAPPGAAEDPSGPTVVKLRGLPFTASDVEIKEFFAGCQIARDRGIHFVVNHDGRNNGEAFVRFETREDYYKALRKDRERMQRRYVEVFGSTEADMDAARRNAEAIQGGGRTLGSQENFFGVVKMRGLPYSATLYEIKEFFKGLEVRHDGVFLCEKDGRPNGEAFVEFVLEDSAEEAVKYHRQVLGSRYVEIFKSSRVDMMQAMQIRDRRAAAFDSGEFFIKMRGIPYTAREREVYDFFTSRNVVPSGVSLVYDRPDQITGTAFIEFGTPDELSRALSLTKETMGHRYVEIFRTTKNEAMQMLGIAQNTVPQPMMDPYTTMGRGMNQGGFGFGQPMQDPWGMGGMGMGGYGQAYGGGQGGYGGGGHNIGGSYGGGGQGGVQGPPGGQGGGDIVGMVGGSTLKIRGLPYRATPQDIADFFRGYQYIPESVQVITADDGRSKGEGFIAFVSEAETSRAFAERNRGHMGNRYIELFPWASS